MSSPEKPCFCYVCGRSEFAHTPVLWPDLVAAWGLSSDEARYIDVQQGTHCRACGSNVRSIALAKALLGLSRKEIRERSEDIAAFTELGNYLALPVRTYSSGMALRLAFAISTCVDPEILLMDEWMAAGDALFLDKAEKRMSNMIDRASILVIASHSEDLIRRLCTKVVYLEGGRVRAFGPVEEGLKAYKKAA